MKHINALPVNPEAPTPPIFCVLRAEGHYACIFDFAKPMSDVFVIELIGAGWEMERVDDHLILTIPEGTNVVPFPLAHPLLRSCGGGA